MNLKKVLIIFLIIILTGLTGYWLYNSYYFKDSSILQASGTIEAKTIILTARANGTIKDFSIKEGDQLRKDQLIAELSRNDLLAQKERDALNVTAAEAKLNDLLSGARAGEIKEASANLNISRLNLQKAELDLERAEKLFVAEAISGEEIQKYRLNKETLENQLAGAEARLELLQEGTRSEVINAAAAEVQKSKAVLKATESLLEDLKVYSPINGVMTSKNYEPGEYVPLGAVLGTVTDLSDMWIKVYIPTDDLPLIKLGEKVSITVSGSNKLFTGTVNFIASQGEFTPKTIQTKKERTNVVYEVKVMVNDKKGVLKPGMPADVTFDGSDANAED